MWLPKILFVYWRYMNACKHTMKDDDLKNFIDSIQSNCGIYTIKLW